MNSLMLMQNMVRMSGFNIISSDYLPKFKMVQFRSPRSKRKRIRNKWSKRPENFKQVPIDNRVYMFGNTVVVDKETYSAMNILFGTV